MWRIVLLVLVLGLASVSVFRISLAARADTSASSQQDAIRLENRLSQVEQRIYALESSLRNLEQQSRSSMLGSRGVSPEEISLLSSQVQALQSRLLEDECGLIKLDERTLPPDVRNARRKAAAATGDSCRTNVDTPLRLSNLKD
jgi:hypothetical protein